MHQALQEVEAARAKVERERRDDETEIAEAFVEATGGMERWRLASQGLATNARQCAPDPARVRVG